MEHVDDSHLGSLKYELTKSSLNGSVKIYSKLLVSLQPLDVFVNDKKTAKEICDVILHELSKSEVIKVALIVTAEYRLPAVSETDKTDNLENTDSDIAVAINRDNFTLRTQRLTFTVNESNRFFKNRVKSLLKILLQREEELLTKGSGWQFESIHFCEIEIVKINLLI